MEWLLEFVPRLSEHLVFSCGLDSQTPIQISWLIWVGEWGNKYWSVGGREWSLEGSQML